MKTTLNELQLFLIRLCIGLDFFPYAIQHLFYHTASTFMVYFVGVCTLLAGIGLAFGVLTRLTAVFASVFLVTALFVGNHNQIGFFWYLPGGGGWEFLAIWAFLCLTYILTGGGRLSVDHYIKKFSSLNYF